MLENALFALVKSTLEAGITARGVTEPVSVVMNYNPNTAGASKGPTVTMHVIDDRRYGWMRRFEVYVPGSGDDEPYFIHREQQWWETTFQISALARRTGEEANFLTLLSALDVAKMASDILQGDAGLAALAVERVRPLRVTDIRKTPWVNESDRHEFFPSFDIVLIHPQIIDSTTPAATVEGVIKNAGDNRI